MSSYEQMQEEFRLFFHNQVAPILPGYEKKRKENVPKIVVFYCIWFTFLIGFSCIMYWSLHAGRVNPNNFSLLMVGFIFIFIALFFIILEIYITRKDPQTSFQNGDYQAEIKQDYERDLKNRLMASFLSIFSDFYSWKKRALHGKEYLDKLKEYRKSNIFNPFPGIEFDDLISLTLKNVKLDIYEINIYIFNRGSVLFYILLFTVLGSIIGYVILLYLIALFCIIFFVKILRYAPFRGVVVELKINKSFSGHTFFLDKSLSAKKIAINQKIYDEVKLESIDFEKKYRVFSTDQVEARYLLTTAMIDRLENLKFAFKAKSVRGSFKDDKLILAINTGKDMFAMGNDFKESTVQTFQDLFDEIISIIKIIDQLKIDRQTGL